jgi:hypothetical protein
VPYPLVSDELAVGKGEGLEAGALGRQLGQRGVRDQDALLQVHPLQLVAAPRQGLTNTRFIAVNRMCRVCELLYVCAVLRIRVTLKRIRMRIRIRRLITLMRIRIRLINLMRILIFI